MALTDIEYQSLEDVVGSENITREPAILDTYNQCWGHKAVFDQKFSTRPAAVVLPGSTEELQSIVKLCNRYRILFKPFSSGFEIVAFALANERGILLDLKRMDRIIEIDVKNMHAVVEPYVNIYRLQREAMKHGVTVGSIGAGPSAGVIAGSCCHFGAGTTMTSTGGLGRNVLGVEWVLPTGEVLSMGTAEAGTGWFTADGPGPSLRGVLRGRSGANGGHGIISKASVKLYPWYGPQEVKLTAEPGLPPSAKRLTEVPRGYKVFVIKFPNQSDMFEALIRIGRAEIASCLMAALMFPYGEGNDEQWAEIQKLMEMGIDFTKIASEAVALVIGADTSRGLEYREKCLMEITGQLGGGPLPLTPSEQREVAQISEDPNGAFRSFGVPHLGGGLQIEYANHVHQNWGPIYDNYDVWLRKIKEMLDPNGVADWSAYVPAIFP